MKKQLEKFRIIQPYLDGSTSIAEISRTFRISIRTLYRWIASYRKEEIEELSVRKRKDKNSHRKFSSEIITLIEGLAFQHPKKSITGIHTDVCEYAKKNGLPLPSYSTTKRIINKRSSKPLPLLRRQGQYFIQLTLSILL